MTLIRALFSRRYIAMTLLVLAAMAVMARLGIWQLDRREQRIARNADLVAKLNAEPVSLNAAAAAATWPLPTDRAAVRNLPAQATGVYDREHTLLLVQQPYNGQPGAHLVTPLVLSGAQAAVLVDRGWIPFDQVESGAWRSEGDATPGGEITVTGRVQPSQIILGQETPIAPKPGQVEWFRIDIDAIATQLPYPLLPVYLLESPPAEGDSTPPIAIEPEVDLSEGPHLGYALQWFAFAITAGIVYLGALRARTRDAAAPPPPA